MHNTASVLDRRQAPEAEDVRTGRQLRPEQQRGRHDGWGRLPEQGRQRLRQRGHDARPTGNYYSLISY